MNWHWHLSHLSCPAAAAAVTTSSSSSSSPKVDMVYLKKATCVWDHDRREDGKGIIPFSFLHPKRQPREEGGNWTNLLRLTHGIVRSRGSWTKDRHYHPSWGKTTRCYSEGIRNKKKRNNFTPPSPFRTDIQWLDYLTHEPPIDRTLLPY